jgi:hypothetical protein
MKPQIWIRRLVLGFWAGLSHTLSNGDNDSGVVLEWSAAAEFEETRRETVSSAISFITDLTRNYLEQVGIHS